MRVSQTPATSGNTPFLPYKEWVAGSNPASPTREHEAHERQVEETKETLSEGPEEFYRSPLD
jgi:hypothetical protein